MRSIAAAPSRFSFIEPLEARIAPAVVVINPLADLVAGSGKTGATVDLSNLFNEAVDNPNRTLVQFITNFDIDPNTAGVQPGIIQLELFDDVTPLTVQNFLTYVNNKDARGDYDDTFIHRSFDFQNNNSNDIIQGGGFETTNVREHIPTGFEVHNEYVLPNTRGTIAMAKTALSPNTATSEWFFNVNNNSSILGPENNGGFTVFGRVISGMEVVDAIAALPKVNASGALTDLPVQNLAGGGQPTASNLVSITDAAVLPREAGNTSGISFQVVGVTDAESGAASTLVNATIVGGKTLDLKYATNQSGVANVTIRAFKDGEFVDETFSVTVKPNLIANITEDLLPSAVVPGELTKAKIRLANNGAATLNGSFDVKFYLSKLIPGVDPQGTTFDAGDILIGQLAGQQLSIAGGTSKTLTAQLAIPAELVQGNTSAYKLIAQVTPVGTAPNELFTDDNNALDGDRHALTNQFGTFKTTAFIGQQALDFGERSNVTLSYLNAAGDMVKLSVKGSGSGQIIANGESASLLITDTNLTSQVKLSVANNGRTEFASIDSSHTLGTLKFGAADVTGRITFSGGVRNIALGDLSGDSTFQIGALPDAVTTKTKLTLGRVQDVSLFSQSPLGRVTATEWRDTTGANDLLAAFSLGSLRITGGDGSRGDFQADVRIFGGESKLSTFSVAGVVSLASIQTNGNVGKVTVGAMDRSSFFAGTTERPDELSDFTFTRSIQTFTVKGVTGVADAFVDSDVAAAKIGTVKVKSVATTSGDGEFGFVADAIRSYNRIGGLQATSLTTPGEYDAEGNYSVTIL